MESPGEVTEVNSTLIKKTYESTAFKEQQATEVITMLNKLNEQALEFIKEENFKEAFDNFSSAESLLKDSILDQIPEPYVTTIYYNIAYLNQKIGRLKECGDYIGKALTYIEKYVDKTNFKHPEIQPNTQYPAKLTEYIELLKKSQTAQINDDLMKC